MIRQLFLWVSQAIEAQLSPSAERVERLREILRQYEATRERPPSGIVFLPDDQSDRHAAIQRWFR